MNRRMLIILGVVFAALALITYLQSRPTPVETPAADRFVSFIGRDLNMTVLDIQAIRLRDPQTEQSFIISRDADGNWTAPGSDGRLDLDAASNIAKTVVLMPYWQTVELSESPDLAQYGFQPNGVLSVEIVLAGDQGGHVIAVGGLSPTGYEYYTVIDEQPRLYLMERGAVDYLMGQITQPPLT